MSPFGDHQEQGEAGHRQQRRASGEATAVVQQRICACFVQYSALRLINLNAAAYPAIGSASAATAATRRCSNRPPALPPGDRYRRRSRSQPRVYWCPPPDPTVRLVEVQSNTMRETLKRGDPMELSARTLGRSGIGVSPIALGCWAIEAVLGRVQAAQVGRGQRRRGDTGHRRALKLLRLAGSEPDAAL
jgi:hypothetical protein